MIDKQEIDVLNNEFQTVFKIPIKIRKYKRKLIFPNYCVVLFICMKFYCSKINTNVNIPVVDGQGLNKTNHNAAFDDRS